MISRRLADLRKEKGLNQKGIAKIGGMSQKSWGNWEVQEPKALQSLAAIARHFGVSADYLLGLTDDRMIHEEGVSASLANLFNTARDLPEFRQQDLLAMAGLFTERNKNDDAFALDIIIRRVRQYGTEEDAKLLVALLNSLGFDTEGFDGGIFPTNDQLL